MAGLLGCFSFHAKAAELSFESDAKVKKANQTTFLSVKSGEAIPYNSEEPLLAITQRGLPILVYCPNAKTQKTTILDTDMSAALQEELRPTLEIQTNDIITQIRKAESLIKRKDYQQAQNIVGMLKEKYKDISSILFMSGTVSYLLDNKNQAIEDLQKGLSIDPSDEAAKRLLTQLKGAP